MQAAAWVRHCSACAEREPDGRVDEGRYGALHRFVDKAKAGNHLPAFFVSGAEAGTA